MAKYDKKSQHEVEKAMHEYKHDHKYKNREQAIAVGLNQARKKGSKAPEK